MQNLHLMNKIFLLLISSLLASFSLIGQNKVYVFGKITDAVSGKLIENVHVKVQQQNRMCSANAKGEYHLTIFNKKRITLSFSHIGYETNYEPLVNISTDTVILNVKLNKKVEMLKGVDIVDDNKPQVVFKNPKISISDYEFLEDKFIFLAYGKRLSKDSELLLVDENEKILAKHFIPGTPVELYTDYIGNINLICKKSIYRVEVRKDKINLYELPLEGFYQTVKPCLDTLEGNILFSDFIARYPRFKYYAFSKEDTVASVIKEVVHKDMDHQYRFEYYSLTNAEKQFAKRLAKRLKGMDEHDVAASMTGFSNTFFYEPVYAPLFVINDTINIFDHYENTIWKYVRDTVSAGEVAIDYHLLKPKRNWKKKLITDELTGTVYALFLKNGHHILKRINPTTGKTIAEKELFYKFVSEIKVKDGYVYYTYKLKETLQKKYLYKERL